MAEFIVWIIVLALAVVIIGIVLLSRQGERQLQDTIQVLKYSNEMILAQLERVTGSPVSPAETTVGVILERRSTQRRNPTTSANAGKTEQRGSPGRRIADFSQTAAEGYSG